MAVFTESLVIGHVGQFYLTMRLFKLSNFTSSSIYYNIGCWAAERKTLSVNANMSWVFKKKFTMNKHVACSVI